MDASEKSFIYSALTFYNAAEDKDTKIQVILAKGVDINASKNQLDGRFHEVLLIHNIWKIHHFKTVEENIIFYSQHSQSTNFQTHYYHKERNSEIWEMTINK